ncbi:hypothetical protein [Flavobacterium sp. IB48]|uniref:hypothetical protein n=1 Tax=Flavobacterium sp. IB48 TaxID=2779375 RepID=UPI0018E8160A|nr:hypothetical protein [Flavobacterium sp. IB48]MBJ2124946.1 hypothetical protein [Flavobacterium sp. IB48]
MTNQNTNKKENIPTDSIKNQFETPASSKTDLKSKSFLYGMSFEQYKEGLEIHCKCFKQMEKAKRMTN